MADIRNQITGAKLPFNNRAKFLKRRRPLGALDLARQAVSQAIRQPLRRL